MSMTSAKHNIITPLALANIHYKLDRPTDRVDSSAMQSQKAFWLCRAGLPTQPDVCSANVSDNEQAFSHYSSDSG